MAIVNVPDTDSFDMWRQKTNLLATQLGDLTLLDSNILGGISPTDGVHAINYVYTELQNDKRRILIRAIAMS